MHPLTAFISSTVHDLADVRAVVRRQLETHYQMRVFASEDSDFPVDVNAHSYQTCLARVRDSSFVVLIIDGRYGGIVQNGPGTERVSITRSEVRTAWEVQKPVLSFVRQQVFDERALFKRFVRAKGLNYEGLDAAGLEDAFKQFRSSNSGLRAESPFVYTFIDEITHRAAGNWFNLFTDAGDLLNALSHRVLDVLRALYRDESIVFLSSPPPLSLDAEKAISASKAFRDHNLAVADMLLALKYAGPEQRPAVIPRLKTVKTEIFAGLIDAFHATVTSARRRTRVLVTDTTMEVVRPDVWKTDWYHQKIVQRAGMLASQLEMQGGSYARIVLLRHPTRRIVKGDEEGLAYMLEWHAKANIRLGFACVQLLEAMDAPLWPDYYLVGENVLGSHDFVFGHIAEVNRREFAPLVKKYVEISDALTYEADRGTWAFWCGANESVDEVAKRLAMLRWGTT